MTLDETLAGSVLSGTCNKDPYKKMLLHELGQAYERACLLKYKGSESKEMTGMCVRDDRIQIRCASCGSQKEVFSVLRSRTFI
ncbi:hypothetical protein DPEC_G00345300 [Dallia pectoralis]|uniref:Uncharacterized protein n=1 Tax=Dallia pectoralis TaxID=75939 RepID=A0ACC2F3G5_DALPE|nr:hypothetical protein DPEC_G00345300 [Dallia pectoralis]